MTQLLSYTTNILPSVNEKKITLDIFLKKLLPVSFLFAYGLVIGNMAYAYISLSFIQMIKSVAPVPMLLLSFALGREKPTWLQFTIVVVVSGGVMMSSVGEMRFSMLGFIMQVCCNISTVPPSYSVLVFCCITGLSEDVAYGHLIKRCEA